MKKSLSSTASICSSTILVLLIICCSQVRAQTLGDYRSVATGNWSTPSTWEYHNGSAWVASTTFPGEIATINNVTLQSPFVVTIDISPFVNFNQMVVLTVNSGATLQDQAGALNYTVAPANFFNISGSVNLTNTTDITSDVFTGIINIFAGGVFSAHVVTASRVSNSGISTITSDYVNGLPINATFNNGIWINQAGSTLNFGGAAMTGGLRAIANGNTVNYYSASVNQTVRTPVSSYYNLTLSGGGGRTKTLAANTTVLGSVSIQGNSSFNPSTFNISVGLDWNNASTSASAFVFGSVALTFNGSTTQNIVNTGNASGAGFSQLIFSNTSATIPQIQTQTDILVYNTLTMNSGVINLNGRTLQFGANYLTARNLNYTNGWFYGGDFMRYLVTGAVIVAGSNDSLYPVGTNTQFRPFYLSTTTAPTVSSSVRLTCPSSLMSFTDVNIPDTGGPIIRLASSSWSIIMSGGTGGTYEVNAGGTGFGIIGDVTDLRLSQASSVAGTAGVNSGTISSPMVQRTGLTATDLSSITFFLGTVNLTRSPLPVELISFSGEAERSVVNLRWQTRSELNCDFFTVYRSSNGKDFVRVGTIKGQGTTKLTTNYELQDKSPLKGINYYRLSQTDWDGTTHSLSLISVEADGVEAVQAYPNPIKSGQVLRVSLHGIDSVTASEISLIDAMGNIIGTYPVTIDSSGNFIGELKIDEVPTGLYFLKLNQTIMKILVQ
ncbi:MAG: hypothetical protein HOP30_08830 [Cyclobacteriaceae bacterium]|nr:hypothetical protein [Cyclobacteriaceae bacterium]